MDENSQNPTPAAPAADPTPTPPANPEGGTQPASPAPAQPPTAPPVPKTIDPVDPNKPAEPAPATPPAEPKPGEQQPAGDGTQPAEPAPADPNAPEGGDGGEDDDPTIANIMTPPEKDDITEGIEKRGTENLPGGVNPDGTVDPLTYAYNQLPEISVMGKVGNGKVQEFKIRTADDLPDGFKYADAKAQTLAAESINQNMNIAREAYQEANQWNSSRQAKIAFQKQAAAQTAEINRLQEEGRIPKFTKKPGDKGFAEDPGAQRAQEVLDFMNKNNAQVKKDGVGQEITSFEFALTLLEAQEAKASTAARTNGINDARNDITGSVSGGSGANPPAGAGDGQRIHRSTQDAVQAGLRRAGKLN